MPKLVFLATDIVLYALLAAIAFYVWHARRTPTLRQTWRSVLHDPAAMSAGVVLALFLLVATLDSVHFRPLLPPAAGAAPRCRRRRTRPHAVAARRAARRPARIARKDLLDPARHAPVLEGIDAGRRQDGARLSAPAIRRRASQGRRRANGPADVVSRSAVGSARRAWSARSLWLAGRRAARASGAHGRRATRCARSGGARPTFPGGRCC